MTRYQSSRQASVQYESPRNDSIADGTATTRDRNSNFEFTSSDVDTVETCALSSDNLLHAGTQLKNTAQVFAVCAYGGSETKVTFFKRYNVVDIVKPSMPCKISVVKNIT